MGRVELLKISGKPGAQLRGFEMGKNLMYSKKENAVGKQGKKKVWVSKQ